MSLGSDWTTSEGESERTRIARSYPREDIELRRQLDGLARVAAQLCGAPIALVTLIEGDRQIFAGRSGLDGEGTARADSFCTVAMHHRGGMTVTDAARDPRFADNPLVTGTPGIGFYASRPLVSDEGAPLGTVCVIDHQPREPLTAAQEDGLATLADAAMAVMERWRTEKRSRLAAEHSRSVIVEREQRFNVLIDALPQMVWSTPPDGMTDYFSRQWCEFTGLPAEASHGTGWLSLLHPDDVAGAQQAWRAAVEEDGGYSIRYRLRHRSGEYRWVLARGLAMRNEQGAITRWIGTCTDVHDEVRASERFELLSQELSHRIKNIFAVIGGLIALSARDRPEIAPLARELQGRVLALGRAHDLVRPQTVSGAAPAAPAGIKALLASMIEPFAQPGEGRFVVEGDDLAIDDRSATPLALYFYELATNSAKYGALGAEGGTVAVQLGGGERATMTWTESGGPAVSPPQSGGFGQRLAEIGIVRQLGGKLDYDWRREGLVVTASVPSANLRRERAGGTDQPAG